MHRQDLCSFYFFDPVGSVVYQESRFRLAEAYHPVGKLLFKESVSGCKHFKITHKMKFSDFDPCPLWRFLKPKAGQNSGEIFH